MMVGSKHLMKKNDAKKRQRYAFKLDKATEDVTHDYFKGELAVNQARTTNF